MSRVKFDVESDGRFLASLRDLGTEPGDRILAMLDGMDDCISWTAMLRDYGWHEIILVPTDGFPGGNRLFSFILYFSPDEVYEIVAHNYAPPEVVCVLARVTRLV
ncbi:hypothetical protein GTP55_22320 [Duganella sp. FT109W]|uniref:Uncharacterized protein n=1 Tax=Duganella margarita TaxID=2692170 RepID=A0ABW9WP92_9BURK|nr:hypothetical protein [Duganella margarita]MYN42093.1 hypothetical protein [Duganella margarita]